MVNKRSYSGVSILKDRRAWNRFCATLPTGHELRAAALSKKLLEGEKRKDGTPYYRHPQDTASNINRTIPSSQHRTAAAVIGLFHDTPDQVAKYDHKLYAKIRMACGPDFDYALDQAVLMAAPQELEELPLRLLKDAATAAQVNTHGSLPAKIAHVFERLDNAKKMGFVKKAQFPADRRKKEVIHHLGKAAFSNRFVQTTPETYFAVQNQLSELVAEYRKEFDILQYDVEQRVDELQEVFYNNSKVMGLALREYTPRFGLHIPRRTLKLFNDDYLMAARAS